MTKLTLKDAFMILGYLIAGASFIFALGVKKANKDNNTADLVEKVTKLEQNQAIFSADQQSLILTVGDFKERFDNYVMKQDQLSVSVKSLALKVAESPMEFARIMEGKTFEVVQEEPMKSIFPNPKIRIQKISKDSVK